MRFIQDNQLLENVVKRGEQLKAALTARLGQTPHVGDIRGRGLFWSVEIVRDRSGKVPFEAALSIAPKIRAAALDAGLICYPSQGCADGVNGDHVLLAPAYTSTVDEIDLIVAKIGDVIDSVLETIVHPA